MEKIVCILCVKENRENNCGCAHWHDLLQPTKRKMHERLVRHMTEIAIWKNSMERDHTQLVTLSKKAVQ
jgi:hypothetical protein